VATKWFGRGFDVSQAPKHDIPTEREVQLGRERERQLIAEAERIAERRRG
jgi:hypothetical protein